MKRPPRSPYCAERLACSVIFVTSLPILSVFWLVYSEPGQQKLNSGETDETVGKNGDSCRIGKLGISSDRNPLAGMDALVDGARRRRVSESARARLAASAGSRTACALCGRIRNHHDSRAAVRLCVQSRTASVGLGLFGGTLESGGTDLREVQHDLVFAERTADASDGLSVRRRTTREKRGKDTCCLQSMHRIRLLQSDAFERISSRSSHGWRLSRATPRISMPARFRMSFVCARSTGGRSAEQYSVRWYRRSARFCARRWRRCFTVR